VIIGLYADELLSRNQMDRARFPVARCHGAERAPEATGQQRGLVAIPIQSVSRDNRLYRCLKRN
jgi:hypothetical protein